MKFPLLKKFPTPDLARTTKAVLTAGATLAMTACGVESTTVVFTPESGVYPQTQTLSISLPKTATNVYLTTDTLDPVPNPACHYAGEDLVLDRATRVKLRFDVQGKTYRHDKLYVIEENPQDSQLLNRTVIEAWELFFIHQVMNQFTASGEENSFETLEDGDGGTATLNTRILERSIFFDIPTAGSQTYSFNFFEKTNADTSEVVMIQDGAIYGYRDEDGGYYTTMSGEGRRLKYAGTYNGWADGDFSLNAEGVRSGGHYDIYCTDPGCAQVPVTYAVGSTNQLIEVSPVPNETTRSCSPH